MIIQMKKAVLLSLAALLLSASAGAQVFNHLSVGAGVGTDGLSLEVAAPLGKYVDVRAGYGTAVGLIGYTVKDLSVPEHPGAARSSDVPVPLRITLGMSDARLLFNLYPSADKGFHFTVGALLGSPAFIRGTLSSLPADYNTVGFDVDGYLVKAKDGVLATELRAPGLGGSGFAVKPYVGIGFGRAVPTASRVSFSFDLGAAYQGQPGLWAEGEGITGRVKKVQLTGEQIEDLDEVIDEVGKYAAFWPTLSFRLYVKLF